MGLTRASSCTSLVARVVFLKDKGIAKLELGELNLSEEDVQKISQRFGIA